MTPLEAWIVSLLGMSVVFLGLVLCIGFINVFSRVAKRVKWEGGHAHDRAPQHQAESEPAPLQKQPVPAEAPTPEVLAVIVAAIEIEQRLYQSLGGQRLTIRR